MAIGRPRQLMGFRPLLQEGSSWDDALGARGGVAPAPAVRVEVESAQKEMPESSGMVPSALCRAASHRSRDATRSASSLRGSTVRRGENVSASSSVVA